jgi:hypothetical protein
VWKHAKRSIFGSPFSLQVSCTTVKCRATRKYTQGLVAYLEEGKVPAGGEGLAYYLERVAKLL